MYIYRLNIQTYICSTYKHIATTVLFSMDRMRGPRHLRTCAWEMDVKIPNCAPVLRWRHKHTCTNCIGGRLWLIPLHLGSQVHCNPVFSNERFGQVQSRCAVSARLGQTCDGTYHRLTRISPGSSGCQVFRHSRQVCQEMKLWDDAPLRPLIVGSIFR